jgi:hypothetical protein
MVLLKRNVHRSLYVSLGIGGEKIGVVTLSQGCQTLLDALHIHRSGDQHRLRAHEIARMRYPVTTQYLSPGTAHAQKIDPLGSRCLGLVNQSAVHLVDEIAEGLTLQGCH